MRLYARSTKGSEGEVEEIEWDVWALLALNEAHVMSAADPWPVLQAALRTVCAERVRAWRRESALPESLVARVPPDVPSVLRESQLWDEWWLGAWAALSPRQRIAVDFRYRWGMPFDIVAAALDVSESTARVHVSAGLGRLRNYARVFPPPTGRPASLPTCPPSHPPTT